MLFAYPVSSRSNAQAAQAKVVQLEAAAEESEKQLESQEAELNQTRQTVRAYQLTACHCRLSTRHCSLQIFKRCCSKGLGRLLIMRIQLQLSC